MSGQALEDTAGAAPPATAPGEVQPLLVLLHIPKTAGMTLATILNAHYRDGFVGGVGGSRDTPPSEQAPNVFSRGEYVDRALAAARKPSVRALAGHITFGLRDRLPADAVWLTVLRDPVERTLSQYYFFVQPPGKRAGAGRGFVPPWLTAPTPDLTLEECLHPRGYIPDNLQTRMLCGIASPYDPLPADALDRARENLESFAHVGTTERFVEFLALLNLRLGWPAVAYRRSNANPKRPHASELPADTLRLVEERNELDRALFDHAAALAEASIVAAGPALEDEVEVLRRAEAEQQTPEEALAATRALSLDARVALARKEAELAEERLNIRRLKRRLKLAAREAAGPTGSVKREDG
jgi:Galactose-3-O-sulfotransferase